MWIRKNCFIRNQRGSRKGIEKIQNGCLRIRKPLHGRRFSIQENEYDEDGEWIGGGDIWKFTPMEIFVVDKETRKTIAKVKTYEEAEEAAEEYEGDAGADIVFYE